MTQWGQRPHPVPGRRVRARRATLFAAPEPAGDGRIPLGGREVDLADITVPFLNIIGEKDHIVPPRRRQDLLPTLVGSDRRRGAAPAGRPRRPRSSAAPPSAATSRRWPTGSSATPSQRAADGRPRTEVEVRELTTRRRRRAAALLRPCARGRPHVLPRGRARARRRRAVARRSRPAPARSRSSTATIVGHVAIIQGSAWSRHVGELRLVVDPEHRRRGHRPAAGPAGRRRGRRAGHDEARRRGRRRAGGDRRDVHRARLRARGAAARTTSGNQSGEVHDLLVLAHFVEPLWDTLRTTGVEDLVLGEDTGRDHRTGRLTRFGGAGHRSASERSRRRRADGLPRPLAAAARWPGPGCDRSAPTACRGRCWRWRRGARRWPACIAAASARYPTGDGGHRRRARVDARRAVGRRPTASPGPAARAAWGPAARRDPRPQRPRVRAERRRRGQARRRRRVPEHRRSPGRSSPTSSPTRAIDTVLHDDEFAASSPSCGGRDRRRRAASCATWPEDRSLLPLTPTRHAGRQVILTSGTTGRPKGAARRQRERRRLARPRCSSAVPGPRHRGRRRAAVPCLGTRAHGHRAGHVVDRRAAAAVRPGGDARGDRRAPAPAGWSSCR